MGVTVTVVAPAARPAGTVAVTEVALQAVVVATVVPKRTVPLAAEVRAGDDDAGAGLGVVRGQRW